MSRVQKKLWSLGLWLILIIFYPPAKARIENLARNTTTGVIEQVYLENSTDVPSTSSITSFNNVWSYPNDLAKVTLSLLDEQNSRLIVAEGAATGTGDRGLMQAKVKSNELVIRLKSLGVAALNNKQFKQLGQSADKIFALTTTEQHQIQIIDKTTHALTSVSFTDGENNSSSIDQFCVAGNKLIVAIFDSGQTSYNSNNDGRIKVYDLTTSTIVTAKKYNIPYGANPTLYGLASNSAPILLETKIKTTESFEFTPDLGHLNNFCGEKNLTQIGAMHWDQDLQRLFIGFSRHDQAFNNKNIMPFLVGYFAGNDLILENLAPLGQEIGIVSFRLQTSNDNYFVHGLATMTDPMARKYLITGLSYGDWDPLNPSVTPSSLQEKIDTATGPGARRIFCVPLLNAPQAKNAREIGRLADKNFLDLATTVTGFYTAETNSAKAEAPAMVGGGPVPVSDAVQITDIKVVGYSVLVSTTSSRYQSGQTFRPQEGGVWSSTALFDETGKISNWSNWQKITGDNRGVFAMHFDRSDGQLWLVQSAKNTTSLTANTSTNVNPYEKGCAVAKTSLDFGHYSATDGGLDTLGQTIAGSAQTSTLISATHFPAVQTKGLGQHNLTVLGFGKRNKNGTETSANIVCYSSGKDLATTGTHHYLEPFRIIPHGFDQPNDVFDITLPSNTVAQRFNKIGFPLDEVAAPTCACIAALPSNAHNSWLLVGTDNGFGVFSKSSGTGGNGAGFNLEAGFSRLDYLLPQALPNTSETADRFYWRKLGLEGQLILDLQARVKSATEMFLYILTPQTLYRTVVTQKHFAKNVATSLELMRDATLSMANLKTALNDRKFIEDSLEAKSGRFLSKNNALYINSPQLSRMLKIVISPTTNKIYSIGILSKGLSFGSDELISDNISTLTFNINSTTQTYTAADLTTALTNVGLARSTTSLRANTFVIQNNCFYINKLDKPYGIKLVLEPASPSRIISISKFNKPNNPISTELVQLEDALTDLVSQQVEAFPNLILEPIFSAPNQDRLLFLHMLPDSNAGYVLSTNIQQPDRNLPLFVQQKNYRSAQLWSCDNFAAANGSYSFNDVTDTLGPINNITSLKLLPCNRFYPENGLSFDVTTPVIANFIITTGALNSPGSQVWTMPVRGSIKKDPFNPTGFTSWICDGQLRTGSPTLISDLHQPSLGGKLCTGTLAAGIAYSYGPTHYWQSQLNSALKRYLATPAESADASINNIRIVNSWLDSATGTQVIAGNFGLKMQE